MLYKSIRCLYLLYLLNYITLAMEHTQYDYAVACVVVWMYAPPWLRIEKVKDVKVVKATP